MEDGDLTWNQVRTVLCAEPKLTAREIRVRLERRGHTGVTRKQVNKVLYRKQRTGQVTASDDDVPRWSLADSGTGSPAAEESRSNAPPPGADSEDNVHMLFDVLG
jgi:hypothetical protein